MVLVFLVSQILHGVKWTTAQQLIHFTEMQEIHCQTNYNTAGAVSTLMMYNHTFMYYQICTTNKILKNENHLSS